MEVFLTSLFLIMTTNNCIVKRLHPFCTYCDPSPALLYQIFIPGATAYFAALLNIPPLQTI